MKGILLTAYSSLGSPDRPGSGEADPVLMDEPIVKEIAGKRNCSIAQVSVVGGQKYRLMHFVDKYAVIGVKL